MDAELKKYYQRGRNNKCIMFSFEVIFGCLEMEGLEPPYPLPVPTAETVVCSDDIVRGVYEAVRIMRTVITIEIQGFEEAVPQLKRFHNTVLQDFADHCSETWESVRVMIAFTTLFVSSLVRERQNTTSSDVTEVINMFCEDMGLLLRKNCWDIIQYHGGFTGILAFAHERHPEGMTIIEPELIPPNFRKFFSDLNGDICEICECVGRYLRGPPEMVDILVIRN